MKKYSQQDKNTHFKSEFGKTGVWLPTNLDKANRNGRKISWSLAGKVRTHTR